MRVKSNSKAKYLFTYRSLFMGAEVVSKLCTYQDPFERIVLISEGKKEKKEKRKKEKKENNK
jgi:hypothetical protein